MGLTNTKCLFNISYYNNSGGECLAQYTLKTKLRFNITFHRLQYIERFEQHSPRLTCVWRIKKLKQ